MDEEEDPDFRPYLLSNQAGAIIKVIDPGVVQKRGDRVTRSEEAALRLVKEYTQVPLPELYAADYFFKDGTEHGIFLMGLVDGSPLEVVWDGFDNHTKERICHELWGVITQLRQIPRPPALGHLYQCLADGSPSSDILLKDLNEPPSPILTDDDLQARIYERYLHYNGGSFPENLPSILPRSSVSVFTHGDLTPRNVMVDSVGRITGILDWENAGWYPDYWEYANIMKPSDDGDWMAWMDSTKPGEWDITGRGTLMAIGGYESPNAVVQKQQLHQPLQSPPVESVSTRPLASEEYIRRRNAPDAQKERGLKRVRSALGSVYPAIAPSSVFLKQCAYN